MSVKERLLVIKLAKKKRKYAKLFDEINVEVKIIKNHSRQNVDK